MTNQILALPMECWRWVPSYEGLYQVSTRGRVRSVDRWITYANGRKHFYRGQIIQPQRYRNGYLYVNLCRNGKPRHFLVHRLVAMAWIDNPENKPEVNHLDETRNNDVYNLSWATAKENNTWGTGTERRAASLSKSVLAIDPKTGLVVMEFPSAKEAGRKGFDQGNVSKCCRGEYGYRTHKGYIWRYKT